MLSQAEIIQHQKNKLKLWRLSEKQEELGEDPVSTTPDEYLCPICYEEMLPPNKRPMMLFPCGHSLCSECLDAYSEASGAKKCAVCNTPMKSSAINYALLNAIENRTNERQTSPQGVDFSKDFKLAKERLTLLLHQMKENEKRSKTVKRELETEKKVLDVLDEELTFVMQQHSAQKAKVQDLSAENQRLDSERESLKGIIDPLILEVQKLELLVEGTTGH